MAFRNINKGIPQIKGDVPAFLDFAPDLDPTTLGALLDMDNVYPTQKGWKTYPAPVKYSVNALPSACLGAWSGALAANPITVAGVNAQLYLLTNQSWTTQGLSLSASTNRWRFDVYGSLLIGVDGVNGAQKYTGTGTFAALGGSPPVASIVQASDFSLFLIETNSNKWHSSLSATVWTDSIATQTVSDNLDETEGNIMAAHRCRGGMTLFKRKAFHYSTFQGPPFYWAFVAISRTIGAPCQEAVANVNDTLYWPGPNDFYLFDGYSLQIIPNKLREWFFETLDQNRDYLITSRFDQSRNCIFWHFPSVTASPAGTLDTWICYNFKTGKWAKGTATIEMPVFAAVPTGELTYDSLTKTYPTYGDMNFQYGDLNPRTVDVSGAIKTDHALYLYNGKPGSAYVTTHDFGDWDNFYETNRVKPYFEIMPTSATCYALNQKRAGQTPVSGPSQGMDAEGRFNIVNTSRLQRYKIQADDEMEIVGVDSNLQYAGEN